MKFTEKLVLVPNERYNQLIKGIGTIPGIKTTQDKVGQSEDKVEGKEVGSKESVGVGGSSQVGGSKQEEVYINETNPHMKTKTPKNIESIESLTTLPKIKEKKGKITKTKIKEKKEKIAKTKKRKSHPRLVPPPPPGIPNQLNKNIFKWISIFR